MVSPQKKLRDGGELVRLGSGMICVSAVQGTIVAEDMGSRNTQQELAITTTTYITNNSKACSFLLYTQRKTKIAKSSTHGRDATHTCRPLKLPACSSHLSYIQQSFSILPPSHAPWCSSASPAIGYVWRLHPPQFRLYHHFVPAAERTPPHSSVVYAQSFEYAARPRPPLGSHPPGCVPPCHISILRPASAPPPFDPPLSHPLLVRRHNRSPNRSGRGLLGGGRHYGWYVFSSSIFAGLVSVYA